MNAVLNILIGIVKFLIWHIGKLFQYVNFLFYWVFHIVYLKTGNSTNGNEWTVVEMLSLPIQNLCKKKQDIFGLSDEMNTHNETLYKGHLLISSFSPHRSIFFVTWSVFFWKVHIADCRRWMCGSPEPIQCLDEETDVSSIFYHGRIIPPQLYDYCLEIVSWIRYGLMNKVQDSPCDNVVNVDNLVNKDIFRTLYPWWQISSLNFYSVSLHFFVQTPVCIIHRLDPHSGPVGQRFQRHKNWYHDRYDGSQSLWDIWFFERCRSNSNSIVHKLIDVI